MIDDLLDLAGDVFLGLSERKSLSVKSKRILETIGILLGLAGMVVWFLNH